MKNLAAFREAAKQHSKSCIWDGNQVAHYNLNEQHILYSIPHIYGCTSNVSLFDLYGVKEKSIRSRENTTLEDVHYEFKNPANPDKKVYAIYDVVHMLKLWRNLLAQCGKIKLSNGGIVDWKFIQKLYSLQVLEIVYYLLWTVEITLFLT